MLEVLLPVPGVLTVPGVLAVLVPGVPEVLTVRRVLAVLVPGVLGVLGAAAAGFFLGARAALAAGFGATAGCSATRGVGAIGGVAVASTGFSAGDFFPGARTNRGPPAGLAVCGSFGVFGFVGRFAIPCLLVPVAYCKLHSDHSLLPTADRLLTTVYRRPFTDHRPPTTVY